MKISRTFLLAAMVPTAGIVGISAISFGASTESECWDEYNIATSDFVGTVTRKDIEPDDCTPGVGCHSGYDAEGRKNRLLVPHGADPRTACPPPSGDDGDGDVVPVDHFGLLPAGAALPSDEECAAHVRPMTENRADNVPYNGTAGSAPNSVYPRVTGAFTGSTDEIIQWTACKWGIDEDFVRAQIAIESWWRQTALGDFTTKSNACAPGHAIGTYPAQFNGDSEHVGQCPESVGLGQVRWLYHQSAFQDNNAIRSSAYNLDYTYAVWRRCYEGEFGWLNTVEGRGDYAAGDALGCLGVWFSGRWYTDRATAYIEKFKSTLEARVWEQASFPPALPLSDGSIPTTAVPTTTVETTSSTTTIPPTTTATITAAPPPTTTTTTAPITTTPPPTTTTITTIPTTTPPTTTAPAPPPTGGAQFVETFDAPSSIDRFEFGVHHGWVWGTTDMTWTADHGHDCGPPEASRSVSNPTAIDGQTYYPGMKGDTVYWCNGHMMTSFNTNAYAQIDFSPKPVFDDVSRICWDQNRTDLGPRQWTQVVVVPQRTYEANGRRLDYMSNRLNEPADFGIRLTGDTFLMELLDGASLTHVGQTIGDSDFSGRFTTTDKKKRYTICVQDQRDGNVRIELEHNSGVQVRTLSGRFPTGPVKVIFQDDSYNPDKDMGVPGSYTWHWDNIVIE